MKSELPSAVVEVTRGPFVESRHLVDIVIADVQGKLVSVYGTADRKVYPRSAVKALQAIPLVESGAADEYEFEPHHLALACASHNGEEFHIRAAGEMLDKIELDQTCLECGKQLPALEIDREKLARRGREPEPIHNNCSGKHSGFLALARHEELPIEEYVKFDHPVQGRIAAIMHEVTGIRHNADNYGIDGCSIPTYAIPLQSLAVAFAKFGVASDEDKARADAMKKIRNACFAHPEYIGGTDVCDSEVMAALGGQVFMKNGAEGIHIAALPEKGMGIALKCHDGEKRAAEVAITSIIESLIELDETAASVLKRFSNPQLHNRNNIRVGELRMATDDG
ncbi:MAG: asparaginase [Rhizobiaceae bacterium]